MSRFRVLCNQSYAHEPKERREVDEEDSALIYACPTTKMKAADQDLQKKKNEKPAEEKKHIALNPEGCNYVAFLFPVMPHVSRNEVENEQASKQINMKKRCSLTQ